MSEPLDKDPLGFGDEPHLLSHEESVFLESPHPKHKGFRGRIDEFIALRRALSQDEIGEMVTHGRPNFLWAE